MTADGDLPVWSFECDWSGDVLERFLFKTDVEQSNSGAELRRGLRATPRRQVEFDLMLTRNERSYFDLWITGLSGSDFLLPIYWDKSRLTQDSVAGTGLLTFHLDTTDREFIVGNYAILMTSARRFEIFQIASVTDGTLTTNTDIANAYPRGTKVYPLRRANFNDYPESMIKAAYAMTSTIAADLVGEQPWWGDDASLPTWNGYPIFLTSPNFIDDLSYKYDRLMDTYDGDVGPIAKIDRSNRAFMTQAYDWWVKGRADLKTFKAKMYAINGRQKAFWLPTFTSDFKFINRVQDDADNISMIDVEDAGYRYVAGARDAIVEGRTALVVNWQDGTKSYHTIVGNWDGAVAGRERIKITPYLTGSAESHITPLPPIHSVSFLRLVRIDNDTLELAHKSDGAGVTVCQAPVCDFRSSVNFNTAGQDITCYVSNVGNGVSAVYEISSPHYDFESLFGGAAGRNTYAPVGTDPGTLTAHLEVTRLSEMNTVLALAMINVDNAEIPAASGSDWTEDATLIYNSTTGGWYGHASFAAGDTADLVADISGLFTMQAGFVFLNDAKIVQMAAQGYDIFTTGGALVELPNAPASGNWLVQVSTVGGLSQINLGDDTTPACREVYELPTFADSSFGNRMRIAARRVP